MEQAGSMSTADLVEQLRRGTQHLNNMVDGLDTPWDPTPRDDPRQVHNMYVKNLVASYVNRFSELSNGVLGALERGDFLVYTLCGRALIETTAMLRYYVMRKYKPLMDSKVLDGHGMKKLVDIDDQHLRGTGFDWESFMFQRYSRLSDAAQRRRGHKGSARRTERGALPKQVPIGRCIDSWSKETSSVGVAYDLFCDMVHPNAGSSFLVASTGPGGLHFTKARGERVGKAIVDRSLLLLLSVTQKPFGQYLAMLMGTVWQDDEIG